MPCIFILMKSAVVSTNDKWDRLEIGGVVKQDIEKKGLELDELYGTIKFQSFLPILNDF